MKPKRPPGWWYYFFLNLKNIKSMDIFLSVLLNPIKWFDFEIWQSDFLLSLSFKLNCVGANPKWIIQFNSSKTTWMTSKNMTYLLKNFKIIFFFNIKTMLDWIDLGHPATWVIDFNEFNNFIVFINYFYLILW